MLDDEDARFGDNKIKQAIKNRINKKNFICIVILEDIHKVYYEIEYKKNCKNKKLLQTSKTKSLTH